ncbi:MAG: ECF transporter S component, partial [Candidatus Methanomethylicia archaeon]|nr:ECF transporter S component [Candidatus Methanomethylicia archaeon]
TRGYFNIGESAVYLVALLAGPYVGAFAGGVGSMLADLSLGYLFFAPATLVIKGIEGGVLGILAKKAPSLSNRSWRLLSAGVAMILSASIFIVGRSYYVGSSELSIGLPGFSSTLSIALTELFWAGVAAASFAALIVISFMVRPEVGWLVLSCSISGSLMVLGYYLYEQFVLGYVAIAEVPFNIGQVLVGIMVSVPAYNSLKALRSTK